ncbi:hypothetical protein [Actinocorallia longicatena]|uniref:Uncharacterized protein n=1 Tax=Actinocorallia longicatena TaxID=111803 RepID=A0ABP6Q898_9ACTN
MTTEPRGRLSAAGRTWRAVVLLTLVGTLFYTSSKGSDDDFPLGPMTQFAFSVKSSGGEIHSRWMEADTADGRHVKLSWDAAGSGLKRAEVEGQVNRMQRDPSLLQGIADRLNRTRAGGDRITRLYVVHDIRTLEKGKVVKETMSNQVVWDVR